MDIDPAALDRREAYRLLISCIVPRPVAVITSVSKEGDLDIGPYSFFNGVSTAPPVVSVAVNPRKDAKKGTLRNIEETGEFVANMAVPEILDGLLASASDPPPGRTKLEVARFTTAPSAKVRPPRLADSPVNLECRVEKRVDVDGGTVLVLARVVHVHLRDDVVAGGAPDPAKVTFLSALRADCYGRVDGGFERKRS